MDMEAFFKIHDGLPREGPGNAESLRWALSQAALPKTPRVLDAGCGPGGDIADLLEALPGAQIHAMDLHPPFIDAVKTRHPQVQAEVGDMATPPGQYDLIWSAGAVYFLGVAAALTGWRNHLTPGGTVIFSELCWFGADRPADAVAYWQQYPAMQDRAGVLRDVAAAGYEGVAHRALPDAAWEAYYQPIEHRISQLRPTADAALQAAIAQEEAEIALWRAHRDAYGYLQVVAQPT